MQEIIGHNKILDFFDRAIKTGGLSHAYLLVGPDQIGKKTVAQEITARLLKVDREKISYQPDYILIDQVFDEKNGKTKKNISISQMRELKEYIANRSYLGGYKIAIINNADKMNIESANALLKTLEEPSEKTILFLITNDDINLPLTIRSRCQKIYFSILSDIELSGFTDNIEKIKLSQGRPGRLSDWLEDEEKYLNYKKEIDRFNSLFGKAFFERLKIVEDLFGDKTDHIAARENLDNVLQIWQLQIRDRIIAELGVGLKNNLLQIEKKIVETRKFLQQNIHPRLLVENILLLI